MGKMKKSIEINIIGHPDELITKAKLAAEKYGLRFVGNTEKGELKGFGIEAHYLLQRDVLTIHILRKPIFLSWKEVERKIRALVNCGASVS